MKAMLITTRKEALDAFRRFQTNKSMLSFDTETTGLEVRNGKDVPRTVQFSWRPWEEAVVLETTPEWRAAIEAFFDEADEVVAHNAKFDIHALLSYGVEVYAHVPARAVHDTLWVARFYDERISGKLKDLGTRFLRADAAADQQALKRKMRANGWDWASVPVDHLVQYGGTDAILTGQLFDMLHPQIAHSSEAYLREQKLLPILVRMERRGLTVDHELLRTEADRQRALQAEAPERIQELAPGLNPASPIQLKATFRKRGIALANTTAETLKSIDDDLARAVLDYRKSAKMVSTYLEPWAALVKTTGRLHPWLNQLGTSTGRFSSSDPNLQNITRGHVLRDIFVAEPGHKLLVADWNQMELRLYAHYAADENMRAAFLSGDDIYQQVADLLGVPRQVGKMIMLASIYGAGPRKLKMQCITMAIQYDAVDLLPLLESYDWEDMYDRFHGRYRIKELAAQCELQARRRLAVSEPYIVTWGGRRQRPKLVAKTFDGSVRASKVLIYKDLANSLVQGGSSDLMKQSMIDVANQGFGDYIRMTVHDEMILEVPDDEIAEVSDAVVRAMTHNEFIPPLTVTIHVVDKYGSAK